MRVYISGQVTGLDYNNALSAFSEAAKKIEERGDEAINPTLYCNQDWDWNKCMRTVLPLLTECDGILMLKGWKKSRGAKLEHFIALKLGLKIEIEK